MAGLDLSQIHWTRLDGMQSGRTKAQDVVQDGHQVAVAVKDPGDGDRLGGTLHGG